MSRHPIKASVKAKVKEKYHGRCAYCGDMPDKLCIDHLKPVAHGGTNDESNLLPSCFRCNNFKMTLTLEQFRSELAEQVNRAREYSVNFRNAERFGQIKITECPIVFFFERAEVNI